MGVDTMTSTLEGALLRLAHKQSASPHEDFTETLSRSLHAIRTHLNMDVGFISEFVDDRRYFRYVDADNRDAVICVGQSDALEDSFCQRVVDGRLPGLITDACLHPEALTLPATRALPVGAHLSAPIRLSNGRIFGTLCCFSAQADHSLNGRDIAMLQVVSDMLAGHIEARLQEQRAQTDIESRIALAMEPDHMRSVYQPIWDLAQQRLVGFEALTRFQCGPAQSPEQWFMEAAQADLGTVMEIHAIECAVQALHHLPEGIYLAINASPRTVVSPELSQLLAGLPLDRLVLEITEHEVVDATMYTHIAHITRSLRDAGLRVAVDDAGAGYASFKHILHLAPDIIKLDVSMTRDIDRDLSRQALAAALVRFAESTHGRLVAEGVETDAELATLRQLGVGLAQGYALGKPMPLEQALQLTRAPSQQT
jgi:EAL domain-containing protein (putative c-di-GMP-specific phosphodiesterase class I)